MRSSKVLPVLALSLGLLATGPAFATSYEGTFCAVDPADASSINFTHWGAHNTSAARHVIHCGAGAKGFNLFSNVMVATVYDRSVADNVSCTVNLMDVAGNVLFATTSTTSGFASAPMTLGFGLPQFAGYLEMDCAIPGVDVGGFSHVTTYDTP